MRYYNTGIKTQAQCSLCYDGLIKLDKKSGVYYCNHCYAHAEFL